MKKYLLLFLLLPYVAFPADVFIRSGKQAAKYDQSSDTLTLQNGSDWKDVALGLLENEKQVEAELMKTRNALMLCENPPKPGKEKPKVKGN